MTALDLDPIRERLADATPGPWRRGDDQHIAGVTRETGRCAYCDHGEPSWAGMRSINGRRMQAHVHTTEEPWRDHSIYAEREDGNLVVVNETFEYDYMDDADAEFIAHAPTDIAALVARVEELENGIRELRAACDLGARVNPYMYVRETLVNMVADLDRVLGDVR